MSSFKIVGGTPLSGNLIPRGNKNEALPALSAALLTEEVVILENVPRIADIFSMISLLEAVGVTVSWKDSHTVSISSNGSLIHHAPPASCEKLRASFLIAAPLLARHGSARLGYPGGDKIGRRRLDPHLQAFSAFGITCETDGPIISLVAEQGRTHAGTVDLDEPGVMATENALMLAASADGESVIYPAACEPHVQGICRMLESMGAQIQGIGSNRLIVQGKRALSGCTHRIEADHIEIGSFLGLAAATQSNLTVGPVNPDLLGPIFRAFRRLGVEFSVQGDSLVCHGDREMIVERDFGGSVPQLADGPWPAIPADVMSILVVTATQTTGTMLLFEKMFESRLFWVDRLIAMGANAILCDPHRVVVTGPSKLHGTSMASPDIRAGMALLIAALAADGESEIHNIIQIDRGYERIEERLHDVGAQIERLE